MDPLDMDATAPQAEPVPGQPVEQQVAAEPPVAGIDQPFELAVTPQKKPKGWMIFGIIMFVLFAAAGSLAAVFFIKSNNSSKDIETLNAAVTERNDKITKMTEEKTKLEDEKSSLSAELNTLKAEINTNKKEEEKKEAEKVKPINLTDTDIKDAAKKLEHEIEDNYKIMVNYDQKYIVVEGREKVSGAGIYIYKENTTEGEWKFLTVTQSVFSCNEVSDTIHTVLHGLVSCEYDGGSMGTL